MYRNITASYNVNTLIMSVHIIYVYTAEYGTCCAVPLA